MKIVFYSDSFYPLKNGVATYLMLTIKQLQQLGHEIMVVVPKPKQKSEAGKIEDWVKGKVVFVPSIPIIIYPEVRLGTSIVKSLIKVRQFKPDVIHFHTPATIGFEGIIVAKILKCPLVGTMHTYFMEQEELRLIGVKDNTLVAEALQNFLWGYAEKFYQLADRVVAPTNYVAKDLRSRWHKVAIEVIPAGIAIEKFEQTKFRQSLRQKHGLGSSQVVLWVGRVSQDKNLEVLIKAASLLSLKLPRLKLVFIGDGPAKSKLIALAQELQVDKKTKFLGAVKYQELMAKNYYSIGEVFVTPSTYETQGLTVIEAMAAGLPVIAAKARAMPELLKGVGRLVNPGDSLGLAKEIERVLTNQELRKRMIEKGKRKVKAFSVEKSSDKLIRLYKSL